MPVILNLVRRVDSRDSLEVLLLPVLGTHANINEHSRPNPCSNAFDIENFKAGKTQAGGAFARLELQWKNAHADQVASVNTLEAFGEDGLHAEQSGTFGRPVAR